MNLFNDLVQTSISFFHFHPKDCMRCARPSRLQTQLQIACNTFDCNFLFLIANCLQYIPLQFAIDRIHNSNQFVKGDPKGTSCHIGHLPESFRFIQPSSSVAVQYIAIYTCILNCTHCNIYMYIDCTYCNIYMYIELYVLQYIHVVQYTVQCIASKWVCNEI